MFESDVSRTDDLGILLVASGGTLMLIAGAMAALVAYAGPRSGYLLSSFV